MKKILKHSRKVFNGWTFLLICLGILLTRSFVADVIPVSGTSMQPTIQDGDNLWVNFLDKHFERGEVIVFKSAINNPDSSSGHDLYIKRVIGLPGDKIEMKNEQLYVNNREVDQSYTKIKKPQTKGENTGSPFEGDWSTAQLSKESVTWNKFSKGSVTVPEGELFVLGDNRSTSVDSRYFGYVKQSSVVGVAHTFFWQDKDLRHYLSSDYKKEFFKE